MKILQWQSPPIICDFNTGHWDLMGLEWGSLTGRPQTGFGSNRNQILMPFCLQPEAVWRGGEGVALETDHLGLRPDFLPLMAMNVGEFSMFLVPQFPHL